MGTATLQINLAALRNNHAALNALTSSATETAAVVKADGYGLGASQVAAALYSGGVKTFFVAAAEEGMAVRQVCTDAGIYVFSGYMRHDAAYYRDAELLPLLNSPEQLMHWKTDMGGRAFGMQLDSGMNRLGFEPEEFSTVHSDAVDSTLLISHLACADEPEHAMNPAQIKAFKTMTDSLAREHNVPRSLAATGGTLLGSEYHFDIVRPGIGLYGGLPFVDAEPVVTLTLPVIQSRRVKQGETVGYGAAWTAGKDTRVATLAAGYADGIIRAMSTITCNSGGNKSAEATPLNLYADGKPCPMIGRVSMDMVTVDITSLDGEPETMDLLNAEQTVDDLAARAGTIGYEILTACGTRYARSYV